MTASSRRQHKALQAISCVAVACALTALSVPAQAQPVSSSSLYYRMGGGSPSGMAPNRGSLSTQLSAGVRANYSCEGGHHVRDAVLRQIHDDYRKIMSADLKTPIEIARLIQMPIDRGIAPCSNAAA